MVYDAVQAGAAGIAAGRNVFQHENPTVMVKVLCTIVHEGLDVQAALKKYNL
jgi:DhnA family fructose-bisphosphate aldolase class Ia